MKQRIFNIIISFIVLSLGIITFLNSIEKKDFPKQDDIEIKLIQPEFLLSENPKKDLIEVLNYYEIEHPEIVYAQAVLETGNFKSRVCKEYNNLFGLYNSKTKNYYKFDHWSESVVAYHNFIQYRYNLKDDYYEFLSTIGYAEDPKYIDKLKEIVHQYDERRTSDTGSVTN